MSHQVYQRNEIAVFLLLTLALSAIFYWIIIRAGSLEANGGLYVFLLMWSPGVAALLTRFIYHRHARGLGWAPGRPKYLLWAYLLPVVYGGIVYLVVWLTGLGAFDWAMLDNMGEANGEGTPAWLAILTFVGLGTFFSLLSALGEEIGWRGYLVPALYDRYSFAQTALISGAIWAVWHAPLILFADYHSGTPWYYALTCFAIMVVGISFPFAWLRLKSDSLWPAVLLHASHNLFIQGFFDRVTANNDVTPYITGEFGIGLAVAGILLAVIFYSQRHRLYRDPDAVG